MTNASRWIWGNAAPRADEYYEFSIPFTAAAEQKIRMQLSVDGEYALLLNGELVAFGQYADYPDYKVHDEIDLPARAGENELRLQAWYTGVDTQTYIKKPAGVRFEIEADDAITLRHKTGSVSNARIDAGVVTGPAGGLTYAVAANWDSDGPDLRVEVEEHMRALGAAIRKQVRP